MNAPNIISVTGLCNSFGDQVIHEDLNIDVRRGEILGVVGGSGTGKSVLMRSIIGLQEPDSGEIRVFDEGMIGKGNIFVNTSAGKDLYTIMKESPMMVGGVSVGAYADEYEMVDAEGNMLDKGIDADEEGYFSITKGGLSEVSIVMQPNNPMANISKLEYFREDGSFNLKVFEKALRDAGISKKDATTAASIFGKATAKRDVETVNVEPTTEMRDAESDAAKEFLEYLEQRDLLKALEARLS